MYIYIRFLFSAQALVLLIKSSDGGYLSTSNQGIYTVRPKALVVTLPVVVSARQILVVTALATK